MLRASALRLFVAAQRRRQTEFEESARDLVVTVRAVLATDRADVGRLRMGGLTPILLRRLDRLISERVENKVGAPLNLLELADQARLSVSQLIRAFRQSTGATPHQYVLALRHRRALGAVASLYWDALMVAPIFPDTAWVDPEFASETPSPLGLAPQQLIGWVLLALLVVAVALAVVSR